MEQELKDQLTERLKKLWIKRTKSEFGAPVIFAKKKNGKWRMCIDYRSLNDITVDDSYPLPNTKVLIQKTKGAKLMSKIDLADGFHQIQVETKARSKTAFRTPFGTFQWRVMPFGAKNALSTFQRFMEHILADEIDRGLVVVYIDDILVLTKSFDYDQHLQDLSQVFKKLKNHNIKVKEEKCIFEVQTIEFLEPIDKTAVRSFMGTVNYCKDFIRNLAIIADPLYRLTRKNSAFTWNTQAQSAFDQVKSAVANAVSLNLPNTNYPFYLECDPSNFGIGSVLYQIINGQRKVLAFMSRKLTRNSINEIVLVFWCHYLYFLFS
ncbi:hypothetical protein ACTFIW_008872 [Dictyostelium discoideum]